MKDIMLFGNFKSGPARCEQCHQIKQATPENPCRNPDWWFCDECKGGGGGGGIFMGDSDLS